MKVIYIAEDGKEFDTSDECLAYEEENLKEEKERKEMLKKVNEAKNTYFSLKNEYEKKYYASSDFDYLRKVFGI